MKKIEIAGFGKRLLAGIFDGAFFVLIWLLLSMLVMTPIINSTMHYDTNMVRGFQFQAASHLYVIRQSINQDTGEQQIIEVKDYTEKLDSNKTSELMPINEYAYFDSNYLLEHLQYFYCNYLTGKNIELPNSTSEKTYDPIADDFVAPNYNSSITLLDDTVGVPSEHYTPEWFYVNRLESNEMYTFNLEKGVYVIKDGVDAEASMKYLRNRVMLAQKDLYYQDFYVELNNSLKWSQALIAVIPFIIDLGIVYFLFPLIFKNGETLGKLTTQLAIVNKNGYAVTKPQILLRSLFFAVEISLFTFVVGIGFTSIATLGVGVLILTIIALVNKDHRTLHDFVAGTMVVDAKRSVWFKNIDEENRYQEHLDNQMEKYRSRKLEDKSIIQVGSTIVDEDVKSEFERENTTESTKEVEDKQSKPKSAKKTQKNSK